MNFVLETIKSKLLKNNENEKLKKSILEIFICNLKNLLIL